MTDTPDEDTAKTQKRLDEALQGTDMGSDTRAGSLRGGSASGSDNDPDSEAINDYLAQKGRALAEAEQSEDPISDTSGHTDAKT